MNVVNFDARAFAHGIFKREVYYTWYLDTGEKVDLIVENGLLFCDVSKDGVITTHPIDFPEDWSLNDAIARLRVKTPVFREDGSLAFAAQRLHERPSEFDADLMIDEENWSLTLVDTASGSGIREYFDDSLGSYFSIAGHASILIERVDQGRYKMERIHIKKGDPEVEVIHDIRDCLPLVPKIRTKSETWATPKYKVQELISEAESERPQFHFNPRGAGSLGTEKRGAVHNCYTWAREKLGKIGIYIDREPLIRIQLAALPRIKLSEKALTSKKAVLVHLNLSQEAQQYVLENRMYLGHADVTERIHECVKAHFGGRSWKAVPQIAPEEYDLSVPVDLDETGLQLRERAILPIKIKGLGIKEVDLTEAVQEQLICGNVLTRILGQPTALMTPPNTCVIL